MDKKQFVNRIIKGFGAQSTKSKEYYSEYVSSYEFKSSGLRIPLFPPQIHGGQIHRLAGPVYDKIVEEYKGKQPDYFRLADYLRAVLANQFYDQGFARDDMNSHCPLGNSCKDWCDAMDINDIRKCAKPGRYEDRDVLWIT